jgi:predicted P-loop ATPase
MMSKNLIVPKEGIAMDYPLKIAVCNHKTDRKYKNQERTWAYLKERNANPVRTSETAEEYPKLSKMQRDAAKDHGGFVGGFLKGGIRKNGNVISRFVGCLDADKIPADIDFPELVKSALPDTELFIYSTHSHTPEAPRYRVVIMFGREVSEDEYAPLMRMVANQIGMDFFDDSTYQPNRLMFWASCPSNGVFVFVENDGEPLDPDEVLAEYDDWRDVTQWPTSSRESEARKQEITKQQDPLSKSGAVGAFCRTYLIEDAIEKFLPDVYSPSVSIGRYDYIPADSSAGVVVYENRWAYSHHASDPASERLLNAFDLVRIHKFGHLDEKASYESMCEFAVADDRVNELLLEERRISAIRDFSENEDWTKALHRDKNGILTNTLHNITLILQNDPLLKSIVFNQLADSLEIKGDVPWKHPSRFWRDADDSQLVFYVDSHYGTFSQRNYEIAVSKVSDDRSYHPIREYLNTLPPWDGTERLETLLIDYLGADDNPYVRAVTRKTLCAAVARIFNPGVKFDNIIVLNGAQGVGKSTLIARLGGDWFSDSLSLTDTYDKSAAEKLQGYWLLEIGELAGMKKADIDKVKGFLSRQDDKYRASFGRRVTSHPRQCVFFGTTNSDTGYLRDISGNRRFWNVKTPGGSEKNSWQLTTDDVAQIWAEALTYVNAGEKLYLDADLEEMAKAEQREAVEHDPREGLVRQYLDMLLPDNWDNMDIYARQDFIRSPNDPTLPKGTNQRQSVSNLEIWSECFMKQKADIKHSDSYAISSIMSRIDGWERGEKSEYQKIYGRQRVFIRQNN